ncbi:MAG TPA: response regulator [Acidimicrobiales bacterium]|nr:response regulator [Acidimicrobiales bacterium]
MTQSSEGRGGPADGAREDDLGAAVGVADGDRRGADRAADLRTAVVADDFAAARHLLVDGLELSGRFVVVDQAADGAEAVEAVARHRPDLALLDLAMPRAGGLDVIEELNELSPLTRVVVVSGFPGRDMEELVLARGAAGFVRKRPSIRAVIGEITVAAGLLELAGEVIAATRKFPQDLSSPRRARRFLDEVLERWDCAAAVDLLHLLLSEVVTNAVVHAHSPPEVSLKMLGGTIRVEVSDDSADVPEAGVADDYDLGGRGIAMVAAAAARWGVAARVGGGKTVWFEVPAFAEG